MREALGMDDLPNPSTSEERSRDSRSLHIFHLIFGHGSSDNPGGSLRLETAGWLLVLSPLVLLVGEAAGWDGESGGAWMIPFLVILGIFLVRSAKKMP